MRRRARVENTHRKNLNLEKGTPDGIPSGEGGYESRPAH
jgi:hypothetical protein